MTKTETIKDIFTILIVLGVIMVVFNGIWYCASVEKEDIEYNGTITMKWKVDKLLVDWYRFEIDNDTILNVDSEYTWYKYNEGDNYSWIETKNIYPNWWLLW